MNHRSRFISALPKPAAPPSLAILCALLILCLSLHRATAQATSTASRSVAISAFAGYENSNPEYGPDRNSGEVFGVNVTKFLRLPVQPSLEGRVNLNNGTDVSEHTYLGGLRLQADVFRHYHPYADFLVGTGTIHFNTSSNVPGYTSDNSTIYNYGGGLDLDLIRNFQAKFDFQYQSWTIGKEKSFTPTIFAIGVQYRFHFRDFNRQGETN